MEEAFAGLRRYRQGGLRVLAVAMTWVVIGCAGPELSSRSGPSHRWLGAVTLGALPSPSGPPTCGGKAVPVGWPHLSTSREVLAPFLACASPAEFIELQRGVDMAELVRRLDAEAAVRLGAQGPLLAGTEWLNRKRAEFIVDTTRDYGLARAEVFTLFIVHSAFSRDLREVLRLLGEDKHLADTVERMGRVREALARRDLRLADFTDRPERLGDAVRGFADAANDALSSSELRRGALALNYYAAKGHLPEPYQQALDELERAEMEAALGPGSVALRSADALTFGVPAGFYNLVAGTCHGVCALSEGRYEQGARELSAAIVLVSLYAGAKVVRSSSADAVSVSGPGGARALPLRLPELGFEGLSAVAERLWARLGGPGVLQLAKYLQADGEAALLVYEGGEAGALGLYEARGDVGKARALMVKAVPERAGPAVGMAGVAGEGAVRGLAALLDEASGLTREVLEAKLVEAEASLPGERLVADLPALERAKPLVEHPARGVTEGDVLWREYVAYYEERVASMKRAQAAGQDVPKPPRTWESYRRFRADLQRGLDYESRRVAMLQAEAAKPPEQRTLLKDFRRPRVVRNAGVRKADLRYADVLVIEREVTPGQPPRVETFSFKSRSLKSMMPQEVQAQAMADARDAMRYYGGTLDLRTPSLGLRGTPLRVAKVHLVYDAGFMPSDAKLPRLKNILNAVHNKTGVEVRIE